MTPSTNWYTRTIIISVLLILELMVLAAAAAVFGCMMNIEPGLLALHTRQMKGGTTMRVLVLLLFYVSLRPQSACQHE